MISALNNPAGNKSNKRAWTDDQDDHLTNMIIDMGPNQWEQMAQLMGKRTGKQCRERWHN